MADKKGIKFSKVKRYDILRAIEEINKNGVPSNAHSSTYDVIYQEKPYPPKLVFSLAYKHATGEEVDPNDFEGELKTKCFEILEQNKFHIEPKTIYKSLERFFEQAQKKDLSTRNYPKWYKGLRMVVSFGKGNTAQIPWISFPYEGQTTQNGIYPVFLYYKEENILILSYSISEENKPDVEWQFTEPKEKVKDYFKHKGYQPPARYGNCYVFKVYDIANLDETEINNDLDQIIREYKKQMEQFTATEKVIDMKEKNEEKKDFKIEQLIEDIKLTGLSYSNDLLARFALSLLTKPFVILSGLSGSGKTRLALSFVKWICRNNSQYKVVPVGADWTNREPLLGYPNALDPDSYICPENNVLELLDKAGNDPKHPYFLILDEMNLSHVERYFADFLSAMESGEPILLHDCGEKQAGTLTVKKEMRLPRNFFIIGTINVDETTYMFSPKVLDRAQVIEFRVSEEEMKGYLQKETQPAADNKKQDLSTKGYLMGANFVKLADRDSTPPIKDISIDIFVDYFKTLKKVGAEFGYRTASEMLRFCGLAQQKYPVWEPENIIDHVIVQKLLPKLHGSRKKIDPILKELWKLCLNKENELFALETKELTKPFSHYCKYPVTAEKVWRMYKNACDNGYTSFAEA